MAATKRTIVRVETRSLSIIHPAGGSIDLWCADCAAILPMVTPEYAARVCGTTPRAIYRRVETGELHFNEIASGGLLVCLASLRPDLSTKGGHSENG